MTTISNASRCLVPFIAIFLCLAMGCDQPKADSSGSATGASTAGAVSAGAPRLIKTRSGIDMASLPAGEFMMGASDGNPDESPPHKVKLTAFLIDLVPVTHEMFEKVQLPDPSHWQDNPKGPVERVRWRDAKAYCDERSRAEGLRPCYNEKTTEWECDFSADGYRLPTEAEWEYAARAGTTGPYCFGSADELRQYGWYADNSDQRTHVVGQKKPNAWGIFDMFGDVSQWCEDVYSPTYYQQSAAVDPTGPPSPGKDVKRVMRGGNWKSTADACRVSYRKGERTGNTDACFATDYCGFRCVRRAAPADLAAINASGSTR